MNRPFRVQQIIVAILALAVLAFALYKTTRPDSSLLRFEVAGNLAYGYGVTDARSVGVVRDLVRDYPQVDTLVLKFMAGTKNADANLKIARRIRKEGLRTHLDADSRIASGAVDLFLAGAERTMDCGAIIGVHRWSTGGLDVVEGGGIYDNRQGLQEKFLQDMGIDPGFYEFTRRAAGPDEIYLLKPADVNLYNLVSSPSDC